MNIGRTIKRKMIGAGRRASKRFGWTYQPSYPYAVQIVPSNACNLRCMLCPKTWQDTDNRHLHPKVYERARQQLFPYVRELSLQGLGEPMLSPLFPQLLDDAIEFDLRIRFVTNATLFNLNYAEKLVRLGAHVTISLDGATDETQQTQRPGNSIHHTLGVFDALLKVRESMPGNTFALKVTTVVTQFNFGELDGILEHCIRGGADELTLLNPGVGTRTDAFAMAAASRHPGEFKPALARLREKANSAGIRLNAPEVVDIEAAAGEAPAEKAAAPSKNLFPGKCYDPWNLIYLDVDGWVRVCCRSVMVGMGNIMVEPFRKIWNSPEYRGLRGSIHSNNPPQLCRTCNVHWGITLGDEQYVDKLAARGIVLPVPPHLGKTYPGITMVDGVRISGGTISAENYKEPAKLKPWTKEPPIIAQVREKEQQAAVEEAAAR